MLKIKYGDDTYMVEPSPGIMLAELVGRAGIMLDLRCAGFGVCGRCQVRLTAGDFLVSGEPVTATATNPVDAPACHTEILGTEAEIIVPPESVVHADGQIAVDYTGFVHPERRACTLGQLKRPADFTVTARSLTALDGYARDYWPLPALRELGENFTDTTDNQAWVARLEDPGHGWISAVRPECFTPLAVAIDIGTTTVAVVLLDLDSNEPLCSVSAYNRQAVCGDNVASRISYSNATGGLERLRRLIVEETINPLLGRLLHETGRTKTDIVKVSVAGNTVMSHLFLGISPRSIGVIPFLPVSRSFAPLSAADCGLAVNPAARVEVLPAIAGYIGGDLTAGIIASGQHHRTARSLLVDIGTNCEIILCDGDRLYACAAAAGPAFEGAGIACGSRAAAGAIDRIDFDAAGKISYTTIDHAPPAGLCGSAMLDFLAGGFNCGLIDSFGRYNLDLLRANGHYLEVDYGNGPVHACVVASRPGGKPVYVSEADIEQVLKAKAAVYAGIKALLRQCKMKAADLEIVFLAGGFAKYLRVASAVTAGMLPPLPDNVFRKIGNSSLAGAVMNAVDPDFPALAEKVIDMPEAVELNTLPEFEDLYIDALMLPNFDPAAFAAIN